MLHLDYAQVLQRKTDYIEALAVIRRAQALSGRPIADYFHPPEWFAKIESLAALAERLPAILKGEDRPTNMVERLDLAQMCLDKQRYAAALRFWTEALKEDPKLGDNRKSQYRYNAACAALLLAAGRGQDATPLDDRARADLRRRALSLLKVELAAWNTLFDSGSVASRTTVMTVCRWWPRIPTWPRSATPTPWRGFLKPSAPNGRPSANEYDALMRKGGENKPR